MRIAALFAVIFFTFTASVRAAAITAPVHAKFEDGPKINRVKTKLTDQSGTNISGMSMTHSQTSPARVQSFATAANTASLGPNLIQNPGFETSGVTGFPANWLKGGYGANTRTLTYPVIGNSGSKAAQVSITSYTSGDAKWYFQNIPITGGATYQFSDYSKSNVPTIIDVQYTMKDGSLAYEDIATVPASGTFTQTIAQFTAPANAVSVVIFHVINRVGTLTVDDYALQQISSTEPPSENLVPNGAVENGTTAPTSWRNSRWGTNTAAFTYPVTGPDGSKAIRTTITGHASGDAKWYFTPLSLSPGVYTYSDQFSATTGSIVTVQFQNANGSFSYKDIATLPASSVWKSVTADFTVPNGTQNVTVFHLIQSNGTLTVDNISLAKKSTLSGIFTTGAVTLRFDDGWLSQYQNALPKMTSAGIKGTFYIVSRQLSDNGFPGYMSQHQVKQLYASGMEIGAHTRTHADLSTLSASAQQTEIQGSRQDLLGWNVGTIDSFAYPFGAYNSTTLGIVKNAGFSSAVASITGDVTPTSDPYQLEHHEIVKTTTLADVKSWIDEAASKKLWLIITIHEVNTTCNTYCVSPTLFNQIVDYLKTKNIPVITTSQGMQSLK